MVAIMNNSVDYLQSYELGLLTFTYFPQDAWNSSNTQQLENRQSDYLGVVRKKPSPDYVVYISSTSYCDMKNWESE